MASRSLRPKDADELLSMVRERMEAKAPVEVLGSGSKRALGRKVAAGDTIDLTGLSGISLYEPEELVLTAMAGTPLADIEAALTEKRQHLAFEPLDLGPLYGAKPGAGTLGGMVATGLAGPRRISAGAVRDHVLGLEAVTGHGELVKAGGRVVKNVTGYDLPKLVTGSFGTLALLTKLTVKVMPAPEAERTLIFLGAGVADGLEVMRKSMAGPYAISGAAYLPAWATPAHGHQSATFLRLEGFEASVAARFDALCAFCREHGEVQDLSGEASADVWRTFRQLGPALADDADDLWRLSVPPSASAGLAHSLEESLGAKYWLDWAGGLVWCLVPPGTEKSEETVRALAEGAGGHAMCLRGAGDNPFHPLSDAKMALTRRIKESFDPLALFNPGRMYEGL